MNSGNSKEISRKLIAIAPVILFICSIITLCILAIGYYLVNPNLFSKVKVTDETVIVDESLSQNLIDISDDQETFVFSDTSEEIVNLTDGDVIVGVPTDLTPEGYLRKIVDVSQKIIT